MDLVEKSDHTIKAAGLQTKGLMLVKRAVATDSVPDLTPSHGLRPVELAILSHFPQLYELLDLEESLAAQAYTFLCAFPPHRSVITLVCSLESTTEQMFPPTAPWRALYSAQALRTCLTHHLDHVSIPLAALMLDMAYIVELATMALNCLTDASQGMDVQSLMDHTLRSLTQGIKAHVPSSQFSADVGIMIATYLVDSRLMRLKGGPSHASHPINPLTALEPSVFRNADVALAETEMLVGRLQDWIAEGLRASLSMVDAKRLVDTCFATLVEASIRSPSFLASFKQAANFPSLIRQLLLESPIADIRNGTRKALQTLCSNAAK